MESDDEQTTQPYRMPDVTEEEAALSDAERKRIRAAKWDEVRRLIAYFSIAFAFPGLFYAGIFPWLLVPIALLILAFAAWPWRSQRQT